MRSTVRQLFDRTLPMRRTRQAPGRRLLFALRVALAASTVVATFAVLTQEPPRPETRWVLAFLASSLFVVAVIESELVRRSSDLRGEGADADGQGHLRDRDAQTKLNQLARHRTDYVYTVSHELRTPLTSIRGFAQLLAKNDALPAGAEVYANTIVSESDKLARIVDDVVDLTRMESTLLGLRKERISVVELLRDVASHLRSSGSPGRVWLDLPPSLPWIRGDRLQLSQVLTRLVLDAISQTKSDEQVGIIGRAGDGLVSITLRYSAPAQRADRLARSLEGLWQCGGDGLATRFGQGELGMYIARNIIEAHGGRVSVAGAEGQVVVSIELPG